MAEPKPFASLSSGLLARKGAAKPAMRPQAFGQVGVSLEDLGWNDMGHAPQAPAHVPVHSEEPAEHVPSSIAALTPSPRLFAEPVQEEPVAPPPVVEQQRAIGEAFAEAPRPAPRKAAAKPAPRQQTIAAAKGRAAFTLRLDAERHLKLRLACAVSHRSAQLIVTEALDGFLASLPGLDALANHVPAKPGKRN